MKKGILDYIDKFLECQKVKAEHRHPAGLLHPFPIPEWKWEVVTMDFITKFPRTSKKHDSIMVVVEKLTKAAHFIPMKITHKETNVVDIYMREVACLHGIPKTIVSNRDPKFTSKFQRGLFKGLRRAEESSRTPCKIYRHLPLLIQSSFSCIFCHYMHVCMCVFISCCNRVLLSCICRELV
jgi:hypothetical protein